MGAGSIGIRLFPHSSCRLPAGWETAWKDCMDFTCLHVRKVFPFYTLVSRFFGKPLLFTATKFVSSYVWTRRCYKSGCTWNSPSSSVVTSPMSKRQLRNVLITAQLYSQNYCTPNTTDGAAKAWGFVFVDTSSLGAGARVGEGQPSLEARGSVLCHNSIWGQR